MSTLEKAIQIAAKAHAGQKDKNNAPYILHPIKVMLQLKDQNEQICGVLHDVLEDTEVTTDDLTKEGFSDEVLEIISLLTHDSNTSYDDYLKGISNNEHARNIKLADLKDNLDISRLGNLTDKDLARINKYKEAQAVLSGRHKHE